MVEATLEKVKMMARALSQSQSAPGELDKALSDIRDRLLTINHQLNDDQSRSQVYLSNVKTVANLISVVEIGTSFSTYGPTPTHRQSLALATRQLEAQKAALKAIVEQSIPALEEKLRAAGAPWIKGQKLN